MGEKEQLLEKNVKEFYSDYPLTGKKSLDVRLIDFSGNEAVFEVKSGEQFKKVTQEINDAFSDQDIPLSDLDFDGEE